MRRYAAAVLLLVAFGCAENRPVVDVGNRPPAVGGTIAGTVTASQTTPLSGRKVTAVNTATNARFETSTAENGGYTLKVPSGTYRIDVELRAGEALQTRPDTTDVGTGDIDAARDFVITRR